MGPTNSNIFSKYKVINDRNNEQLIKHKHPKFIDAVQIQCQDDKNIYYNMKKTIANINFYIEWRINLQKLLDKFNVNKNNKINRTANSISLLDQQHSLLLPIQYHYQEQGLCGTSGFIDMLFSYFPYTLQQQIANRKQKFLSFQQKQIWFLLYIICQSTNIMHEQQLVVGDIKPINILINNNGDITLYNQYTLPDEEFNYSKTFYYNELTYLSPQGMVQLKQNKSMPTYDQYIAESFSIGLVLLDVVLLNSHSHLYNISNRQFNMQQFHTSIHLLQQSNINQSLKIIILLLLTVNPQNRISTKQVYHTLYQYQKYIYELEDFYIEENITSKLKQLLMLNNHQEYIQDNQEEELEQEYTVNYTQKLMNQLVDLQSKRNTIQQIEQNNSINHNTNTNSNKNKNNNNNDNDANHNNIQYIKINNKNKKNKFNNVINVSQKQQSSPTRNNEQAAFKQLSQNNQTSIRPSCGSIPQANIKIKQISHNYGNLTNIVQSQVNAVQVNDSFNQYYNNQYLNQQSSLISKINSNHHFNNLNSHMHNRNINGNYMNNNQNNGIRIQYKTGQLFKKNKSNNTSNYISPIINKNMNNITVNASPQSISMTQDNNSNNNKLMNTLQQQGINYSEKQQKDIYESLQHKIIKQDYSIYNPSVQPVIYQQQYKQLNRDYVKVNVNVNRPSFNNNHIINTTSNTYQVNQVNSTSNTYQVNQVNSTTNNCQINSTTNYQVNSITNNPVNNNFEQFLKNIDRQLQQSRKLYPQITPK